MVLHALHLCSGYGGFELALRLAGIPTRTVAHVERDSYAAALLVARMAETHLDQAPIWSDLDTFDPQPWRGRVDIITAGFPCQPFSAAGAQRGVDDERWLWPSIGRIVRDVGPRYVLLENVPGLVRAGLPHVLSDLARFGFDAEWGLHSASEVGAPHKRERFWLLAHTNGVGRSPWDRPGQGTGGRREHAESCSSTLDVGDADGTRRPEKPRSTPSHETTPPRPQARRSDHVTHRAGEGLADTDGDGLKGERRCGTGHERHPDRRSSPTLAHTDSARPERPRGATVTDGAQVAGVGVDRRHQWPPGRDDTDGWADYIAEGGPQPALRRSPHGRPAWLADALHAGGNGLIPAVAASALLELARRLEVDMTDVRAVTDTEQP